MFRYWDGRAWSPALSPTPYAPTPYEPTPYETSPSAAPPGSATPSVSADAARRPDGRSLASLLLIGALVVALLVGGWSLLTRGTLNPFDAPVPASNPTSDFCPKPRDEETPTTPRANPPGRVQGGKLSYPLLASPWSAPYPEDRVPFGRDVSEQSVIIEANYDGFGHSWVASILVGELVAGDGFFSPEQGSKIVATCVLGEFYDDAVLQRTDVVSQATTVGGKDAWLLEMHLSFNIRGLKEKGETAIILIVATGQEASSIYYASIPDSRPDLLAESRQVQSQLRVEP